MTYKVQKIREEVVEIVNSINPFIPDEDGKNSGYEAGKLDAATQILQIIDSLEEPVSNPIDFEKELYKAFGQVKDFTLGMRIAKWFYDMGKNNQEHISEKKCMFTKDSYTDEDRKVLCEDCKEKCEYSKKKEPVSEDLGGYINELSKQFPEVSFAKLSRIAVRVAKWQKENLWKPADGDDLKDET